MISYAEKLTSVYPGGVKAKIAFGNCGSDGNDAAVKFARATQDGRRLLPLSTATMEIPTDPLP